MLRVTLRIILRRNNLKNVCWLLTVRQTYDNKISKKAQFKESQESSHIVNVGPV